MLFPYRCNLIKTDSQSKKKAAEYYFVEGTVFRKKNTQENTKNSAIYIYRELRKKGKITFKHDTEN